MPIADLVATAAKIIDENIYQLTRSIRNRSNVYVKNDAEEYGQRIKYLTALFGSLPSIRGAFIKNLPAERRPLLANTQSTPFTEDDFCDVVLQALIVTAEKRSRLVMKTDSLYKLTYALKEGTKFTAEQAFQDKAVQATIDLLFEVFLSYATQFTGAVCSYQIPRQLRDYLAAYSVIFPVQYVVGPIVRTLAGDQFAFLKDLFHAVPQTFQQKLINFMFYYVAPALIAPIKPLYSWLLDRREDCRPQLDMSIVAPMLRPAAATTAPANDVAPTALPQAAADQEGIYDTLPLDLDRRARLLPSHIPTIAEFSQSPPKHPLNQQIRVASAAILSADQNLSIIHQDFNKENFVSQVDMFTFLFFLVLGTMVALLENQWIPNDIITDKRVTFVPYIFLPLIILAISVKKLVSPPDAVKKIQEAEQAKIRFDVIG